jgi:saccharopine dehydrogenase-like NADP-dependent oxidoreductase
MTYAGNDVALCSIEIQGIRHGRKLRIACEIIDSFDENHNITATARLSAHPVAIAAQLLMGERIATRGVVPPEMSVAVDDFLRALRERGIKPEETSGEAR